MFGIDSSEFLLIGVVAIVVVGPRDLPRLMRVAGRWIGKARRLSSHVRAGMDEMIRQAEATANDAVPVGRLPTSPAQLATMLLTPTPDTRSKEPGGEQSTLTPLLPGPLALSLAPPRASAISIAEEEVVTLPAMVLDEPLRAEDPALSAVDSVPPVLVTRDTRSREPGGAESTVIPLRPGALAESFAPFTPPAAVDAPDQADTEITNDTGGKRTRSTDANHPSLAA